MRTSKIAIVLLFASMTPCMALGADQFTDKGMAKIREELGPNCHATLSKVGQVVSGNNGVREEQWFLETCHGIEQYWVAYYPPQFFPARTTDLEVTKVADGAR